VRAIAQAILGPGEIPEELLSPREELIGRVDEARVDFRRGLSAALTIHWAAESQYSGLAEAAKDLAAQIRAELTGS
jgi:hypothetical protein